VKREVRVLCLPNFIASFGNFFIDWDREEAYISGVFAVLIKRLFDRENSRGWLRIICYRRIKEEPTWSIFSSWFLIFMFALSFFYYQVLP